MFYYAVRVGRRLGVYHSWSDCYSQVNEFSGAQFMKFKTIEEAQNYLSQPDQAKPSAIANTNQSNQSHTAETNSNANTNSPLINSHLQSQSQSQSQPQPIPSPSPSLPLYQPQLQSHPRFHFNSYPHSSSNSSMQPQHAAATVNAPAAASASSTSAASFSGLSFPSSAFSSSHNSVSSLRPTEPVSVPAPVHRVYCDGASRSNPGLASFGYSIVDSAGEEIHFGFEFLGKQSNNVAEYSGVMAGLLAAQQLRLRRLEVMSDSELIIGQVSMGWKCNSKHLLPFIVKIKELVKSFDSVKFTKIPRAENRRADELANLALDKFKLKTNGKTEIDSETLKQEQ